MNRRCCSVLPGLAGVLVAAGIAVPGLLAQEPTLDDVLAKAAAATNQFTDPSRVIVCEERYKQTFSKLIYNTSGRVETKEISSRELVAELAFVDTPSETPKGFPWMEFRDVIMVDKKPVRDGVSRLGILSSAQLADAITKAWDYTKDAMGFQFGEMPRTAVLPRAAMLFLHGANQARFEFKKAGTKGFKNVKTWELKYQEKGSPTIMTGNFGEKNARVKGSLWVDPVSGRVYAATISSEDEPKLKDDMSLTFGEDKVSGLWVPVEMKHKTEIGTSEEMVNGEATYKNCRAVPRKTS